MGIIFALIALLSWGFGDFLIQRGTRRFGDWITLFYIEIIGTLALFPFVYQDLPDLLYAKEDLLILLLASFVILLAALFDFEGLKRGKISVIEPVFTFEIAVTASLAALILGETLGFKQITTIMFLTAGIFLVSVRSLHHLKSIAVEKGVGFAIIGMALMGVVNFLFGYGARETSPLMINWFTSVFLLIGTGVYITTHNEWGLVSKDFRENRKLVLAMGLIDNLAWVAFAFSMTLIPIAIATGLSESYIALAALLGIFFNREKLKPHQFLGLSITIISAIILAYLS